MNALFRSILLSAIIPATVTGCMLLVYHTCVFRDSLQLDRVDQRAKAVAEKEFSLSGKYAVRLRSTEPTHFTIAAALASKAVVSITTSPVQDGATSRGSGVMITSDGYIVTNYHVVRDASRISVLTFENRMYDASLIGFDEWTDIALLKTESCDIMPLVFGNSDSLQVGEWVLAAGNPFGLQSSITAGIVSATSRTIGVMESDGIESFIQTDAAINPGNSGGALVNSAGELVGMTTAVMSESGRYEGFSFAIPSRIVRKVADDLLRYGAVQRAWLGARCSTLDFTTASAIGISQAQGVLVVSLYKNGAAEGAGILEGDVILSIDGKKIQSVPEMNGLLALFRPGDKISCRIWRDGKEMSLTVALKNQMNTTEPIRVFKNELVQTLGLEIRDATRQEKEFLRNAGAVVMSVQQHSQSDLANIQPGFVVSHCNGVSISSAQELMDCLQVKKGSSVRIEGYYKGYPGKYPYLLTIPDSK